MKFLPVLLVALLAVPARATVSFSESFADRLVRSNDEGEIYYDIVSGGRFTARGKVVLAESDLLMSLDGNTPLSVTLGGWTFDGVLGDDPKFIPGKSKSVSIPLPGGSLKLAVGRGALTWSVTAKSGTNSAGDDFEDSAVAESLQAEESFSLSPADEEVLDCAVAIASASASATLPLRGTVKFVIKSIGMGDDAEEFGLCTVKVKGTGFLTRD